MDIRGLKTGNYVEVYFNEKDLQSTDVNIQRDEKKYYVIEAICDSAKEPFVLARDNPKQIGIKSVYPIILTEDLILHCGFAYSGKDRRFRYFRNLKTTMGVAFDKEKFYFNYCDKIGDIIIENRVVEIHYLHQLQNLHFILTGEELDINING